MNDAPAGLTVRLPTPIGSVSVRVWPAAAPRDTTRPVLFACHGWADSAEVFGPLATALDRKWTVVAPDAPGHGGTPWPPESSYSVPAQTAGALAVLDALPEVNRRRAPVVAFGHSTGALTSARVAAARPRLVVHLLLEEPARTTPRRTPSTAVMRAWLHRLRATDHEGRLAYLRREHPDWPEDEYEPWARGKAEVDVTHLDSPVDWGESLLAVLSDVICPVTLVHGLQSRGGQVSRTAAARCASVCAGGADVIRFSVGHNPRREARDRFVTLLTGILRRYGT